mmetsp:Transcript_24868/g.54064  ORF Transcript_24868/g.54064 Transcript_24868/m.54064 type:complete len:431 (-) Transcript_24868:771-2063(-)
MAPLKSVAPPAVQAAAARQMAVTEDTSPTLLRSGSQPAAEDSKAGGEKDAQSETPQRPEDPCLTLQRSAAFRSERPGLERLESAIDPHHCLRASSSVSTLPGEVQDVYIFSEVLGRGAFGTVTRVEHRGTRKIYALKTIQSSKVDDIELFERELAIARRLKHPYIVHLHHICRDDVAYHLVMDLCTGGDLLDRVRATLPSSGEVKVGARGLSSEEVCKFLGQMLKGIAYLHNFQFAHRDVKPENYLLESKGPFANIKLIDFGLARCFKGDARKEAGNSGSNNINSSTSSNSKSKKDTEDTQAPIRRMTSKVGSICYVAPEVVESPDGYDARCDIWSIGVTVWVMAAAARPFDGKRVSDYIKDIKRQLPLTFDPATWGRHPEELKAVVRSMLTYDADARPTAHELLRSEHWLRREQIPASARKKDACCSLQ